MIQDHIVSDLDNSVREWGAGESGLWICSTGVTSANYSSSPSRSRARFLASCIVEIDFWLLRIRIRIRTTDPPNPGSFVGKSEFNRQWGRERNGILYTDRYKWLFLLLEVSNPEGSLLERGTRHLRHHLNVQVRSKKEDD